MQMVVKSTKSDELWMIPWASKAGGSQNFGDGKRKKNK